jgi:hypothetical protein
LRAQIAVEDVVHAAAGEVAGGLELQDGPGDDQLLRDEAVDLVLVLYGLVVCLALEVPVREEAD